MFEANVASVHDYPLLELFTRLREAGLPLGLGEYQLALRALQGGFGLRDRAALKRLCCTLWIKSAEEKLIFEDCFKQVWVDWQGTTEARSKQTRQQSRRRIRVRSLFLGLLCLSGLGLTLSPRLVSKPAGIAVEPLSAAFNQPLQRSQNLAKQGSLLVYDSIGLQISISSVGDGSSGGIIPVGLTPTPVNSRPNPWTIALVLVLIGAGLSEWLFWLQANLHRKSLHQRHMPQSAAMSPLASAWMAKTGDEIQLAQTLQPARERRANLNPRFQFHADYFPISRRQLKQSWRYLRRSIREGPRTELDAIATADQIGRCGLLLEPVLVPRRTNRTELLLLIDREGSMLPFHRLAERLVETALSAGRLGKADVCYFHNCPIGFLYQDPYHQQAETIANRLHRCPPARTVVLIFSDSGAARGGLNPERVERTEAFLQQLRSQVRSIVWLNPMPVDRWTDTTAAEIARRVPMFEVSRADFQHAIDTLRKPA